ncbi:hypothetical protein MRX96_042680 [Rhipicephalus microplus]
MAPYRGANKVALIRLQLFPTVGSAASLRTNWTLNGPARSGRADGLVEVVRNTRSIFRPVRLDNVEWNEGKNVKHPDTSTRSAAAKQTTPAAGQLARASVQCEWSHVPRIPHEHTLEIAILRDAAEHAPNGGGTLTA